jgi:transcriptional regulator with XRE-family HTH domain
MQDVVVGSVVRAVRRRLALRQCDVAERAGVSQQTVSVIELGRLDEVDLATLRRVCAVLGIQISLAPRWRGPELDRLLDAGHARIVEAVVGELRSAGWMVEVEWSFSHYGERGAVDVLAWQPERRALAIVEVKTRVVDLQDLLGTLDRKVRVALKVLPDERGWRPLAVARIVVLPDTSTARDAVGRHAVTFAVALPGRTVQTRQWMRDPVGDLRSVWFLRNTTAAGGPGADGVSGQRVRVRSRSADALQTRDTSDAGAIS